MKNLLNPKIITGAALFFASTMILASCNDPSSPTPSSESAKTYDVTYYNGDTVLKTEKVEEGKILVTYYTLGDMHINQYLINTTLREVAYQVKYLKDILMKQP